VASVSFSKGSNRVSPTSVGADLAKFDAVDFGSKYSSLAPPNRSTSESDNCTCTANLESLDLAKSELCRILMACRSFR